MQIGPLYLPFEYLVVGLIALFIVISVIANGRRKQQFAADNARIDSESEMRGWTHAGERISGTEKHTFSGRSHGIAWTIESEFSTGGSDGAHQYTRWRTDQMTLPGEVIIVLPKKHGAIQLGQISGMSLRDNPLAQAGFTQFFKHFLGIEPLDLRDFENLQAVDAGGSEVREHFTVLAASESSACRFLDDDAKSALIGWGQGQVDMPPARIIGIMHWSGGIYMMLGHALVEPAQLDAVVKLGTALASGQRGA